MTILAGLTALLTGAIPAMAVPPGPVDLPRRLPPLPLVPGPAPVVPYVVDVHAVLTADDAGNGKATITEAEIEQVLLERANTAWYPALFFRLDGSFEVNDSRLFYDCVPVPGAQCSMDVSSDAREAYALQPALRNKLVVFFRNGGSGGFSCQSCHFVAMPGSIAGARTAVPGHNLLAHEVGHYFWISHTFAGPRPTTLAEAQERIRKYVDDEGHPKSAGLDAFDADRGDISDTPPDPGELFWAAVKGHECSTGDGTDTYDFTVNLKGGPEPYTLAPNRRNIMSYFQHCLALDPLTASGDQLSRARSSVSSWNRQPLTGALPRHFGLDAVPLSQNWASAWKPSAGAIVPFVHEERRFMFTTAGSAARITLLDGGTFVFGFDSLGAALTWTGTWDAGYSHVVPFADAGEPYLLAYNPTTGITKIYRVDPYKGPIPTNVKLPVTSQFARVVPPTTWTRIVPFTANGLPHGFRYASQPGRLEIFRLNPGGTGIQVLWSGAATPGLNDAVALRVSGSPYAILYGKGGTGQLLRLDGANGATLSQTLSLPGGAISLIAFDRGDEGRLLVYSRRVVTKGLNKKKQVLTMDVYRVTEGDPGPSVEPIHSGSWSGWSRMVLVRQRGLWNLFQYRKDTGAAQVHSIVQ